MTTAAETQKTDKELQKEALKAREKDMEARETKLNEGKTGKGTRTFLVLTRGRNPQEIAYEQWDDSQPDTLPKSFAEVLDLHKARGQEGDVAEKEVVRRWILGDNDILYSEASDPVAEFVDSSWTEEVQKQFKLVVKNYANATGVSIEDAVALIKPGIVASQKKA